MKLNNTVASIDDILSSDNPIGEIEKLNVQIYPAKFRIDTNDKFTETIFHLTPEQFATMQNGKWRGFKEKKNHKVGKNKFIDIVSPYRLFTNGFVNNEPLDEYDRAVLSVFNANWYLGNRFLTPAIIYRGVTGKVNDKSGDSKPSINQLARIMKSVNKLMTTIVSSDISEVCENLNYNDGTPLKFSANLIYAKYITATINGQETTIIELMEEPILFKIARLKGKKGRGQLLTYDAAFLDVPNQKNTEMNVALKNYSMQRIQEIILHQMTPTLTFNDIFDKCRITQKSKKNKFDARQTIITFLEHLREVGVIDSFELIKHGNSFDKITFTYSKKKHSAVTNTLQLDNSKTDKNTKTDSDTDTKSDTKTDTKVTSDNKSVPENLVAETEENTIVKPPERMAS